MIHAGLMRNRVELQRPAEVRGLTGEATLQWTTEATVWASVDGLSTRELLQAQQANVIATHRVVIRHYPTLTHEWRIIWEGKTLEISSVVSRDNSTRMEILAKESQ